MIKKFFLFLLALILFMAIFFVFVQFSKPVSNDPTLKGFLITRGSSASKIANDLEEEKIIRSSLAFKFYVQFTGKQSKISAGEFRLSPSMSLNEIVDTLQKGPVEIWVTIPEGLRHEEIAEKFATGLGKDKNFQDELERIMAPHEGYLFPETYLFSKEITAEKILDKLLATYNLKTANEPTNNEIIMASIIERETKSNDEKPIVAGILYKRIENGWPLQVDASIQYAKGDWKPILVSDKELNSLYNTYKYQNLPPGPICNPGISSIDAAQNPQESEYWYYLHEDNGTIHYASSLEEHNVNIKKYLLD